MKINDTVETILHVIPKITSEIPTQSIDVTQLRHVNNLFLADPWFDAPGSIDILLGADVLEEAMLDKRIEDNGVVIRESIFCWIISGPFRKLGFDDKNPIFANALSSLSSSNTEDLFANVWDIISIADKKRLSNEEWKRETQYDRTTEQKANGRSSVQLSLNYSFAKLGLSKAVAVKRFLNVETKLLSNAEPYEEYSKMLKKFIETGHLKKVPEKPLESQNCYFFPHHCNVKPDRTTKKLSAVFDATAKDTSGVSLNQGLMEGPKLQKDVSNILNKFRFFFQNWNEC